MSFKNLGKFCSYEEVVRGKYTSIVVSYTSPTYQDPTKVFKVSIDESACSEALMEKIVSASSGEEYCFTTDKNDKGYSVLVDITAASDATPKTAAKSGGWGGKSGGGGTWQPKDETGIAIGAAWTNAIEIARLLQTGGDTLVWTVEDIECMAWDIVNKKRAQEDKLRAEKATSVAEPKTAPKPMSKMEQMKAKKAKLVDPMPQDLDDDDGIVFDEE